MSRQFYDRALSIFLHYVVLSTAFNAGGQLLTTFVMFQNQIVYGCFIVDMVFAAFYGITFFERLHDFQGNLDLFIPENQLLEDKIEPLDIKVDARTLQLYLRKQHLKYSAA